VKRYNLLNHELGDVNVKMRKQKAALAQAADETEKAVLEKGIQEKELIIRDYEPYKIAISNLRKDINERKIDESRQELFDSEFVTSVKKDLYARKKELESTLKLSSTWHEIADTMRPY